MKWMDEWKEMKWHEIIWNNMNRHEINEMNGLMHESMNEWMDGINESIDAMNQWMNGLMHESMNEWMDECMNEMKWNERKLHDMKWNEM